MSVVPGLRNLSLYIYIYIYIHIYTYGADTGLIPGLGRLPGKFHGQRSLAGYTVHGVAKESDMTEHAHTIHMDMD